MKKNNKNIVKEISSEYDFSDGIRGKHYKAMSEGYTVTVYSPSKTSYDEQVTEHVNYVKIDKEVSEIFKTSDEINNALKAVISAIPKSRMKSAGSV